MDKEVIDYIGKNVYIGLLKKYGLCTKNKPKWILKK